MPIVIEINENNRRRRIDLSSPLATIGRSSRCDVKLEDDLVSSRHAKLKVYQDFAVIEDLNSSNGLFVDGDPVSGEREIGTGNVVQFGRGGPTLQIIDGVADGHSKPDALAVNAAQDGASVDILNRYRTPIIATVGALGCLCVFLVPLFFIGGFMAFLPWLNDDNSVDAEAIFDRYGQSAYLVCYREKGAQGVNPFGTAWVIDSDGIFATNGHVVMGARAYLQQKPNLEFFVVSPGGKREFPIIGSKAHRQYAESGDSMTPDVGVLRVRLTGNPKLVEIPLANDRELRAVKQGAPLCYIGYPVFYPSDYSKLKTVVPRIFQGNIVRWMDLHEEEADADESVLMEHDMFSWGGASGSPIFGACGKAIALHFAGGTVHGERQQASIKFGIRVDLLREVLEEFRNE